MSGVQAKHMPVCCAAMTKQHHADVESGGFHPRCINHHASRAQGATLQTVVHLKTFFESKLATAKALRATQHTPKLGGTTVGSCSIHTDCEPPSCHANCRNCSICAASADNYIACPSNLTSLSHFCRKPRFICSSRRSPVQAPSSQPQP